MTYSNEDVVRIAYLAAQEVASRLRTTLTQERLDECVHAAINEFWDEELSEKSDVVTYTINGKQFEGVAGTVLTFPELAEKAGVKNADTCVFKRKRALARDGLLRQDQTVRLQGGMSITIVNTGSA